MRAIDRWVTLGVLLMPTVASAQFGARFNLRVSDSLRATGVASAGIALDKCAAHCQSWFPARDARTAAALFGDTTGFSLLNAGMVGGNGKAASATLEFASTYIGPVRLALGSVVANADSAGHDATQRLLAGGGTAVAGFILAGPTAAWQKTNYIMLLAAPRIGFNMPALGGASDASSADYDAGIELRCHVVGSNGKLGLYAQVRTSLAGGLGEEFYKQIGLASHKGFSYTHLSAGFTVPVLNIAILWSKAVAGPRPVRAVTGDAGQIVVTVLRGRVGG